MLAAIIALSSLCAFPASAAGTTVKVKTIRRFTEKTYVMKKSTKREYKCKVKYNDGNYIKTSFSDDGKTASLSVFANKVPEKRLPVVKIVFRDSKKKLRVAKTLKFKIEPAGKLDFENMNINTGTVKETILDNPFDRNYTLKASNSKLVSIKQAYLADHKEHFNIKALKTGSTTVSVYIKSTKIGSFKVTNGDFETTIPEKYQNLTLYYNSHGSSTYMGYSHVDISDILEDKKAKTKYAVYVEDESVASVISANLLYSTGLGKTTAEVFQKIGNHPRTSLGKINITVKKISMAYVVRQNVAFYNDGIFGNGDMVEFLDLKKNKTLKLAPTIKSKLLNNDYTGSAFKSSDYKITYKSSNSKVVKVDSAGKATAVKAGFARVRYTITFSDKTKYSGVCPIDVQKD